MATFWTFCLISLTHHPLLYHPTPSHYFPNLIIPHHLPPPQSGALWLPSLQHGVIPWHPSLLRCLVCWVPT